MRKDGTVARTVTNTARFGRVTQYRVTLDGVTFTAEHTSGAGENYSLSTHVGVCGISGLSSYFGGLPTIKGGRGIAERFLALATELRADPANFIKPEHADSRTRHASMCTDEAACGRFRTIHPTDRNVATEAEQERAKTAGTYAFNTGHPNVWHESARMRAMLNPGDQHTARGRTLIDLFESTWESNAAYARSRDTVTAGA